MRAVQPTPLAFSPDGTKLVAATDEKTVLVWNLRRIRGQLTPLGLDWNAPSYPAFTAITLGATAVIPPPRPVRVVGEIVEPPVRRRTERAVLDRRLAANPDDTGARIHRGWLSLSEGRLPEAIADLDHLHRQKPEFPDVQRMLGHAYHDGADSVGALDFYGRVLTRAPDDQDTRFKRALTALALGRAQPSGYQTLIDSADNGANGSVRFATDVLSALQSKGRPIRRRLMDIDALHQRLNFNLFHLRGTAYDGLGKREPAQLAWEKAHSYLPKDPDNLNHHARIMAIGPLSVRDPEKALVLARYAVTLAPDPSLYLSTLGAALYGVGLYSEAIDVLKRSLGAGQGENDASGLFCLAMAHRGLGHRAHARRYFDRAVRRSPADRRKRPCSLRATSGADPSPCRSRTGRPGAAEIP